jgi:hypothetical protein
VKTKTIRRPHTGEDMQHKKALANV